MVTCLGDGGPGDPGGAGRLAVGRRAALAVEARVGLAKTASAFR
jgi:hypothetical protein